MKIQLCFFSTLKSYFKRDTQELIFEEPQPVRKIFLNLFEDKILAEKFLKSTRFAVNCEYVSPETLVHDGDELALIPPVSGG